MTYTTEEAREVARTIVNQLTRSNNGYGRLEVMLGATNFHFSTEHAYVGFKFKMCRKFNYCRITLNARDLYDVEFMKINTRTLETTRTEEHTDMYADGLKDLFEQTTGLYLSL